MQYQYQDDSFQLSALTTGMAAVCVVLQHYNQSMQVRGLDISLNLLQLQQISSFLKNCTS
jgi:hypothetical protein